jgi:hypothetical protein
MEYGIEARSMAGFTVSRLMCGGMVRCFSARVVLMRPAMPAAASVCPMFVLVCA